VNVVSKGIIDLHGGRIGVYSEGENMGTTFYFEVPVVQGQGAPQEDYHFRGQEFLLQGSQKAAQKKYSVNKFCVTPSDLVVEASADVEGVGGSRANDTSNRAKVLIVDDAATNRKMLRLLLARRRYQTEEAEDGLQGVQMVKQRIERGIIPYDAIIMDFIMPNMDGPTATARIRALGYNGVIVGVTGNAMQNDIQTFLGKGADKVLNKPLDIDEFVAAVVGKFIR